MYNSSSMFHVFFYSGTKVDTTKIQDTKKILRTIKARFKDEEEILLEPSFIVTDEQTIAAIEQNAELARYILLKIGVFVSLEQLKEYIQAYRHMKLLEYLKYKERSLDPIEILRKYKISESSLAELVRKRALQMKNGYYPNYVELKKDFLKSIQKEFLASSSNPFYAFSDKNSKEAVIKLREEISKVTKAQGLQQQVPWRSRAEEIYTSFEIEDATTKSLLYTTLGLELILTVLEFVPFLDLQATSRVSKKFHLISKFVENEHFKKMSFALCSAYGWIPMPKQQQKQQGSSAAPQNNTATTTSATTTSAATPSSTKKAPEIDFKKFFFQTVFPLYYDSNVLINRVSKILTTWKPEYLKAIQPGIVFNSSEYIRACTPTLELPIGASKTGGLPDLPFDMMWPEEHTFLVQINFSKDLQNSLAVKRHMPTLKVATTNDNCTIMYLFMNQQTPNIFIYNGPTSKLERKTAPEHQPIAPTFFNKEMPIWFMETATFPELVSGKNKAVVKHYNLPDIYKPMKLVNYHLSDHTAQFNGRMIEHGSYHDGLSIHGTFLSPIQHIGGQTMLRDENDIVLLSFAVIYSNFTIVINKDQLKRLKFDDAQVLNHY